MFYERLSRITLISVLENLYILRVDKMIVSGLPDKEMTAMELGLAHSLSRYKLKFSPDKIDTMIVQVTTAIDSILTMNCTSQNQFLAWTNLGEVDKLGSHTCSSYSVDEEEVYLKQCSTFYTC